MLESSLSVWNSAALSTQILGANIFRRWNNFHRNIVTSWRAPGRVTECECQVVLVQWKHWLQQVIIIIWNNNIIIIIISDGSRRVDLVSSGRWTKNSRLCLQCYFSYFWNLQQLHLPVRWCRDCRNYFVWWEIVLEKIFFCVSWIIDGETLSEIALYALDVYYNQTYLNQQSKLRQFKFIIFPQKIILRILWNKTTSQRQP